MEEIKKNELISEKHKRVCKIWNYPEHLLILGFIVTGCVLISAFSALVGVPVGITSSAATITFVQQLQELKSMSYWLKKKRKRSMVR